MKKEGRLGARERKEERRDEIQNEKVLRRGLRRGRKDVEERKKGERRA